MMGARNALMVVKNQCLTKTTKRFFFVRVHVALNRAMAALRAPRCAGVDVENRPEGLERTRDGPFFFFLNGVVFKV